MGEECNHSRRLPTDEFLELLMGRPLGHPAPKDVWGLAVEGPRKRPQWTFPRLFL